MGIVKRTFVDIRRKPFRAVSLTLIFSILCFMSIMGEMVRQSMERYVDKMSVMEGICINVQGKNPVNLDENRVPLEDKIIRQIVELDHVIGYNSIGHYQAEYKPVNCVNVPYQATDNFSSEKKTENIIVIGNLNTAMWEGFRCNNLVLEEGVFPDRINKGIMVDSVFAEKNNLQLGQYVEVLDETSSEIKVINIIGIYRTLVPPKIENVTENGTYYMVSPSSYLFSDLQTYNELCAIKDLETSLNFYVDSYDKFDSVYDDICNIVPTNKVEEIYKTSDNPISDTTNLIFSMRNIVINLLSSIYIVGFIILTLMTILWIRDHSYETGIYIALGIEKYKILVYYGVEIIVIVAIGGCMAALLANILINTHGNIVTYFMLQITGISDGLVEDNLFVPGFSFTKSLTRTYAKWILCSILATVSSSVIIMNYDPRTLFRIK